MEFCSDEQYEDFLATTPRFEKHIIQAGIILVKFWLEVGQEEQEKRFRARIDDPMRQWKLSPMDLASYAQWYEFSLARDRMLDVTDTPESPWHVVRTDDKKRARLNVITHLLSLIPHGKLESEPVKLPKRSHKHEYDDQAPMANRRFIPELY
jgi:polyphosphate kinase 2 (PPK2 family)